MDEAVKEDRGARHRSAAILAILRELVRGELAVHTDYVRCPYCGSFGHWTPEFVVEHAPDCPIARGRAWLARIDRQAESD